MKVVILAGGVGTRLAEETRTLPKPLVEIGHRPILWHLMQYCSHYGLDEFVIALGYRGELIKRYLADQCLLGGNIKLSFAERRLEHLDSDSTSWQVELVDTGAYTQTGGRIKRLSSYLSDEAFLLLWSDGLFDVDLNSLLAHHRRQQVLATMMVVSPPPRYGYPELDGDRVVSFDEKPVRAGEWINAGVFVLEPQTLEYIADDQTEWERGPLQQLADAGQLSAYRHSGYWQCMDTLKDRQHLNELWQNGNAPWKKW